MGAGQGRGLNISILWTTDSLSEMKLTLPEAGPVAKSHQWSSTESGWCSQIMMRLEVPNIG